MFFLPFLLLHYSFLHYSLSAPSDWYSDRSVPFELHVYESVLATLKDLHTQEHVSIKGRVDEILQHFSSGDMLSVEVQVSV